MTEDHADVLLESERPALTGLAYRMLGNVADAEDAVQEACVRWVRMDESARAKVHSPGAWLMRTTSRICLDVLASARVRRETYVGPWLPEPLPAHDEIGTAGDPAHRAALDDSVSMALQVVLDTLTPAERVALVMHDAFGIPFPEVAQVLGRSADATRQLASSARRKVRERRGDTPPRECHDAAARAFAAAAGAGDLDALLAVLAPDVALTSDGGGKVSAARRPVLGAAHVAQFLLGLITQRPDARIDPVSTADGLGFLVSDQGTVDSVIVLDVAGDQIANVWIVRNPDKLTRWGRGTQTPATHPAPTVPQES